MSERHFGGWLWTAGVVGLYGGLAAVVVLLLWWSVGSGGAG